MTISLVSVFIPVLFMGGIVGRLLHEFSVTIAVAILVSGFVSLTLTPMLGSRFLKSEPRHAARLPLQRSGALFPGDEPRLRTFVAGRSAAPPRDAGGAVRAAGRQVWLFFDMPKGFLPEHGQRRAQRDRAGGPGHFVRLDGRSRLVREKYRGARSQLPRASLRS